MSIHVLNGHGSPIDNNVAGTPGCHYIDLDTGDHYLFGTDTWALPGSSGGAPAMNVLTQDASANASLTLDFSHTDVVLDGVPGSGNITLDMSTIDPTSGQATTGEVDIYVLSETPVELTGGYGGSFVAVHDGITFASNVFTPPSGASGMAFKVKQLGAGGSSGHTLMIEASAFTWLSQVNV